jgi:hypothetical protein
MRKDEQKGLLKDEQKDEQKATGLVKYLQLCH